MNLGISFVLLFVLFGNFYASSQQTKEILITNEENPFKEEQIRNLALTQYYRWFQTFERELNDARVKNHLSILSDSVTIITYNGPLYGKEGMLGFLNYVSSWKNSHHIETVRVNPNDDGTISLEADIEYQNILPDGKQNAYKLHYKTQLVEIDGMLPLFIRIELLPTETMAVADFEDAYIENRSKSFVHYWLYLMNDPVYEKNKFEEVLASDFRLESKSESITNHEEFESWKKRKEKEFDFLIHSPKNFRSTLNEDQTISVSLDIEWKGINKKGEKIVGEEHQDWILENNSDDRFAQLREVKSIQSKAPRMVTEF